MFKYSVVAVRVFGVATGLITVTLHRPDCGECHKERSPQATASLEALEITNTIEYR